MLKYVVPLIFVLSSANSWRDWAPKHQLLRSHEQVASEAQVKFALENKYDDTGPGAKQPENAYRTYKNLEDALVAYLDDPDTKLPEHEREKAINKLTQSQKYLSYNQHPFQQNERFKPQFQPQNIHTNIFNNPIGKISFTQDNKVGLKVLEGNEVFRNYQAEKKEPFKLQRINLLKGSPLSVAHYTKDPDLKLAHDQFEYPKYTFSYGVHDKHTGDSKSAQESRDGGSVRGFYSFRDADGKTRTVHYTADDQQGFRAEVQKT